MKPNLVDKTTLQILSVVASLITSNAMAKEYYPADPNQHHNLSKNGSHVMQGLLGQMGLKLPDEKRVVPPTPGPAPTPQPDPAPGPAPAPPQPDADPDDQPSGDDFFDDDLFDDDFFNDEVGFDDVVKAMDAEYERALEEWDKEYERAVAEWEKARIDYLSKKDDYVESAIDPQRLGSSILQAGAADTGPLRANISAMRPGDFYVIPGILDLAVRNQGFRGTCAAFAQVRAMEAVMMQNGVNTDLSEEHLYFLSKPKCQQTPCGQDQAGSGLFNGLQQISSSTNNSLVPEDGCPYKNPGDKNNITHAPLRECRPNGVVRSGRYGEIRTFDQALDQIRNNNPVLAGYGLTRSYQDNKGLVKLRDPVNKEAATGQHAPGHATLFVGYIKLPPSLVHEGNYCIITANSWADGWGFKGYACLTEAWLKKTWSILGAVQSVVMTDTGLDYYRIR